MHNVQTVGSSQTLYDLGGDPKRPRDLNTPVLQQLRQAFATQELHDHVPKSVVGTSCVVHLDDVLVICAARCASFVYEATLNVFAQ